MQTAIEFNLPFKTALYYAEEFFGMSVDETRFEDLAYIAWKTIGNRQTCKYLMEDVNVDENGFIELPSNVLQIEYVVVKAHRIFDSPLTADFSVAIYDDTYNDEAIRKFSKRASYTYSSEPRGQYIPYELTEDGILIKRKGKHYSDKEDYSVLYHGLIVDDEGFPKLSQREAEAIAYFVGMMEMQRNLMRKTERNGEMYGVLKREWERRCKRARVSEKFSQNFMDTVLNIKGSYNRKTYNRSLRRFKDL